MNGRKANDGYDDREEEDERNAGLRYQSQDLQVYSGNLYALTEDH